jgi:UDP-GlcNAc:undecaprenyl-phosphate/decaprenyl-phosphate GlcNAc-1-phosphate transferase
MIGKYLFTALLAILLSAITQFLVIRLSHRRGIFLDDHESDQPQKFHDAPTPRIGGIGLFIACLLMLVNGYLAQLLLLSSLPAFLVGVFEDLRGNLSPKLRLAVMLASGLLAIVLCNAVVTHFGIFTTPYAIGAAISFIAIVGLINGTNMIDGYNGLLGFTAFIIFCTYAVVCYQVGDDSLLMINLIIAGGIAGFLLFNYPGGGIFMGDGGAYFLGFLMAVMGMMIAEAHSDKVSPFFVLCSICYPVLEVIFSFARKGLYEKISPMHPDKWHFHMLVNRVLCAGKNSRTVWVIGPLVLATNIISWRFYSNFSVLLVSTILFCALYLTLYAWMRRKNS